MLSVSKLENITGFKDLFTKYYENDQVLVFRYELAEKKAGYYVLHNKEFIELLDWHELSSAVRGEIPVFNDKRLILKNEESIRRLIALCGGADQIKISVKQLNNTREQERKVFLKECLDLVSHFWENYKECYINEYNSLFYSLIAAEKKPAFLLQGRKLIRLKNDQESRIKINTFINGSARDSEQDFSRWKTAIQDPLGIEWLIAEK